MEKVFNVNSEIYSEDKIVQAISDFEEVASISFEDNLLMVKWNNQEEIDEFFNEFMNYLVWLINE